MKPQIQLHNAPYNMSEGEMPVYWAMKERECLTQEMQELAELQQQTNMEEAMGIESPIGETQEFIDIHYNILTAAWQDMKLVNQIYLT